MVNMNNLYSFYVCAEQLSFSKAASILGISQPSLSMQIKNLEEQLGTLLFLRNGKKISLTSKGQELQKSYDLFSDLSDEVKKCAEVKNENYANHTLRILVTDEVERPFVAEVVSKFAKKEKKRIAIYSAMVEEAIEKAINNETDFLLSHEKINTPWSCIRADFPVFFVTSSAIPKLPTFNDPSDIQSIMDYFGQDIILPASSIKLGREFASFSKKHHLQSNIILESNIISCLARFVAIGAGCSFLPLPYIKSSFYEDHIHLIGPREGYWRHSIFIYANMPKEILEVHPLVKNIRRFGSL